MIGATPTNRTSAANTMLASGTWTIRSPGVCAGPTSISRTSRPATESVSSPPNSRVGGVMRTPEKSNGDRIQPTYSPSARSGRRGRRGRGSVPTTGRGRRPTVRRMGASCLNRRSVAADSSRIRVGGGAGRDDVGAGQQLIAKHVVPVRVGVDERPDRLADALGDLVQHALRQPQVEERVDQQRLAVAHHDPGIRLAPLAVRLQPGEHAVADLLEAGAGTAPVCRAGALHEARL